MLKLLIKFFPAFIPLVTYFIWILFLKEIVLLKKTRNSECGNKNPKIINMEKKCTVLNDPKFIISVMLSFVILIIMFVFLAFGNTQSKGDRYIPAKYEDGKIVPAKKIADEVD